MPPTLAGAPGPPKKAAAVAGTGRGRLLSSVPNVAAATLLALVDATPSGPAWARGWVEGALAPLVPKLRTVFGGCGLHGWSVGTVIGDEPLAQSRPVARAEDDPLDDLLRVPGRCIVAALDTRTPDPSAVSARPAGGVHRFRRFLSLRAQPELPPPLAKRLAAELPEYLARGRRDRPDAELVLLSFIAELQSLGGLSQRYATAEQIQDALIRLDARMTGTDAHHFMVTDGRTLGVLARGGTLLAFDAPEDAPRLGIGLSMVHPGPAARLLVALPGDDVGPDVAAERIADGCLTIEAAAPWRMQRA